MKIIEGTQLNEKKPSDVISVKVFNPDTHESFTKEFSNMTQVKTYMKKIKMDPRYGERVRFEVHSANKDKALKDKQDKAVKKVKDWKKKETEKARLDRIKKDKKARDGEEAKKTQAQKDQDKKDWETLEKGSDQEVDDYMKRKEAERADKEASKVAKKQLDDVKKIDQRNKKQESVSKNMNRRMLNEDMFEDSLFAVFAVDTSTGEEYCAGVYDSLSSARYWAAMDSISDKEYNYGDFKYRVEEVPEYSNELLASNRELNKLKLQNHEKNAEIDESKSIKESAYEFRCPECGEDTADELEKDSHGHKSFRCASCGYSSQKEDEWEPLDEAWHDTMLSEKEIEDSTDIELLRKCKKQIQAKKSRVQSTLYSGEGYAPDLKQALRYFERKLSLIEDRLAELKKDNLKEDVFADWKPDTSFKHIKDIFSKIKANDYKYANNERDEFMAAVKKADNKGYKPEQCKQIKDWHKEIWQHNRKVEEAFKPSDSGIQSVKCYNQYGYTRQELRVDNDAKTFQRGNFTAGKPDKKTKNRQEFEDVVDTLKDLGYTEIKSDYKSMRNKSRKGELTEDSEPIELKLLPLSDPKRPKFPEDIDIKIDEYFKNNNAPYILDELHYNKVRNTVEFDIMNGDWKHEHMRAKWLLDDFFREEGIDIVINSYEIGQSEDDTYSAHYIIRTTGSNTLSESLFEDVDAEALKGPKEGAACGIASLLIDAINGEWETIETYNSLAVTARAEGFEDFAKVIDDINTEENIHVGQLQELLKTISPNAEAIKDGEEEGKEQLEEELEELEEDVEKLEDFIEGIVADAEYLDHSDIEGIVMARCMQTGEDEDEIIAEIEKRISA